MALNAHLDTAELPDAARAGLRQAKVVTLYEGQVLFRFASSDRPKEFWASSPWWMYEHDYRRVIAAHKESGWSLGLVGRSAMAVRPSHSRRMDVVVKAMVLDDINAFCGLGRTQHRDPLPNGMYLTLPGWSDVSQLYIPGISDRCGRTRLGFQAISIVRQKIVSSFDLLGA